MFLNYGFIDPANKNDIVVVAEVKLNQNMPNFEFKKEILGGSEIGIALNWIPSYKTLSILRIAYGSELSEEQ